MEKTVYIFRENGGTYISNWFVISATGRMAIAYPSVLDIIKDKREFVERGFQVQLEDVPIGEIVAQPHKYRQLTDEDKEMLSRAESYLEETLLIGENHGSS